jgi:hypothetical protein
LKVTRIYTGDDNESHFEDLDIPLNESRYGSLSDIVPVKGVMFRETPIGGALGFHNAPQRQFVVNLSGVVELETGDGTRRRLGAGDILLADDTTGRGHITRDIEGPRYSLFLPLPEDFDVSAWRTS